jgi:hypothetical protein
MTKLLAAAALALALSGGVAHADISYPGWDEPKASDPKTFMRAFSADIQNATNSKDEASKPTTACYAISDGSSYCSTMWVRVGPVFTYTDEILINAQGDAVYVMRNKLRDNLGGKDHRVCQTSLGRETVERYDATEQWNTEMLVHKLWADYR